MHPTIFLLFCGAVVLDLTIGAKFKIDLGQQGLFEGDIQLPKRTRNGILAAQRWPDNTIYYEYGTQWSDYQINMIQGAIQEIENSTCIKFVKKTNQANYISIYNGTDCSSPVGYLGDGVQKVSLKDSDWEGCWTHETVVHELLHTVGLWHEQSRYDRDDYISINMDNVHYCMRHNFDIQPGSSSNTYDLPYNYLSVMHYGTTAFSSNNIDITIIPTEKYYFDLIGKVKQGAPSDYVKVNRIYQCGMYQNYVAPPALARPAASAFDNPELACVSVDCHDNCALWATNGDCQKNPEINKLCPKSCGTCLTTTSPPLPTTASNCIDQNNGCSIWAKRGYCALNPSLMHSRCAKSCGIC